MDTNGKTTDAALLTRAHVVPFAVFMGFLLLQSLVAPFIEWRHPAAPWWRQDTSQWIYPIQTIVCLSLLIHYRKSFDFRWSGRWCLIGLVFGVVGIGFWLLPTFLHDRLVEGGGQVTEWMRWFGVEERSQGFNPGIFEHPAAYWASVLMRFLRAVVVVALLEEIFWRGFLMRFVLDPNGDYWKQPFGRGHWLSFVVVTGLFVMAHAGPDRPAALVYGTLTYVLCVWSRSLGACVVMHAVANLLMGFFIMAYGKYGLW